MLKYFCFLINMNPYNEEGNMANNRITEGVGKKIVEALKMQDDIEINPAEKDFEQQVVSDEVTDEITENNYDLDFDEQDENIEESSFTEEPVISEEHSTANVLPNNFSIENLQEDFSPFEKFASLEDTRTLSSFNNSEIEDFEMPSNVAVLKQLITKLPAGVTKQTGALIIKQTMEALGISMRSVLQEAQQVQENLNRSARECISSIEEHKKQISILEKQAQTYQKQYAVLNDVISVFVQTSI